jgi:hypothetical protein
MKVPKVSLLMLLAVSWLTLAAQQAAPKPNLTGKWVFSAQQSRLKVPPPTSMLLEVTHNDPQIRFARTQFYGDQKFSWDLDTVTDGQKEIVQNTPTYTANVRVYWEGSSLVLDQQITASDGTKAKDVVTYSLVEDGKALQAVERETVDGTKGSMTNTWVYERQAQ